MGWKAITGIGALVLLIASIAGGKFDPIHSKRLIELASDGRTSLASVLSSNAEMRLTGEMLSSYARAHPPRPWRGFKITVLNISVQDEVRIKAHVSGYMIHTPVDISGSPDYDAKRQAIFFRVTKAALPEDAARPVLSRFNAMLTPLATYVAQNVADVIPVKRIKNDTARGWMFLTAVQSVRVDKDRVVLVLRAFRVAAAIALMLCALLFALCLMFWLKQGRRRG